VPIAGLASNHNVLPYSSFALVVADAYNASVKDAIELPTLTDIFVVIIRRLSASTTSFVKLLAAEIMW